MLEKLVARPRAGGVRRYACAKGPGFSGCGKTYINADEVERFVSEAVLVRLDSAEETPIARSLRGLAASIRPRRLPCRGRGKLLVLGRYTKY